jgi:hypothetical protein
MEGPAREREVRALGRNRLSGRMSPRGGQMVRVAKALVDALGSADHSS